MFSKKMNKRMILYAVMILIVLSLLSSSVLSADIKEGEKCSDYKRQSKCGDNGILYRCISIGLFSPFKWSTLQDCKSYGTDGPNYQEGVCDVDDDKCSVGCNDDNSCKAAYGASYVCCSHGTGNDPNCDDMINVCVDSNAQPNDPGLPKEKKDQNEQEETSTEGLDVCTVTEGTPRCEGKDSTILQACKKIGDKSYWVKDKDCADEKKICSNNQCIGNSDVATSSASKKVDDCTNYEKITEECKCGIKTYTPEEAEGKVCCDNKLQDEKDCNTNKKCISRNKELDPNDYKDGKCLCNGEEIDAAKQVCCSKPDETFNYAADNADQCKERVSVCSNDCDLPVNSKNGCLCAKYCSDAGQIKKDDQTCGNFEADAMCNTDVHECFKGDCKDLEGYVAYPSGDAQCQNNGANTDVKCCIKQGDSKPSTITRCNEICKDPDGCMCPGDCTKINDMGDGREPVSYPIEGAPKGADVPAGWNCQGEFGVSNPCSGPSRDTRDFYCPPGCFFFNDYDCAPDKNLGNMIWDYVLKKEWREAYEEKWVKKVEEIGAYFNPDNWAKSFCNPTSDYYDNAEVADTAIMQDNRPIGWIGANRQAHGQKEAIYTISWYVKGLEENNSVNLTALTKIKEIKELSFYQLENSTSKEETFAFVNETLFSSVCIEFGKEVCYTQGSLFGKEECKKKICRDIVAIE